MRFRLISNSHRSESKKSKLHRLFISSQHHSMTRWFEQTLRPPHLVACSVSLSSTLCVSGGKKKAFINSGETIMTSLTRQMPPIQCACGCLTV
jgi:hypothetical protein